MGLFDSAFNAISNAVGSLADKTYSAFNAGSKNVSNLLGNISSASADSNPQPQVPPTVQSGAIKPTGPVSFGPYQNFSSNPNANRLGTYGKNNQNSSPNLLYTPVLTYSTGQGMASGPGLNGQSVPITQSGGNTYPTPPVSSQPTQFHGEDVSGYQKVATDNGWQYIPINYSQQGPQQGATGQAGTGSLSFNPFSSTGVTQESGGAALIPSSFANPFSGAGAPQISLPSDEDLNRKRTAVINQANTHADFGQMFRNLAGIPTANAGVTPLIGAGNFAPNRNQPNAANNYGGIASGPNQNFNPAPRVPTNYSPVANYGPNQNYSAVNGIHTATQSLVNTGANTSNLSNAQNNLLNIMKNGSNAGQYGVKGGMPVTPNGTELANGLTGRTNKTSVPPSQTQSAYMNEIVNRGMQVLQVQNTQNSVVAQQAIQTAHDNTFQQLSNGGQYIYYKQTNPQTGQVDVLKTDANGNVQHVDIKEFHSAGPNGTSLNIDHLPDAQSLTNSASQALQDNINKLVDPTTGLPIPKDATVPPPDSELAKALQASKDAYDQFVKDHPDIAPNTNFDLNAQYAQISSDAGLTSLKTQKVDVEKSINALVGQYDKLANEIKNDPDFSLKLKGRRLDFNDTQKQQVLAGFQRELGILDDQITNAQDVVDNKMKYIQQQYMNDFNMMKEIQSQTDKIQNEIKDQDARTQSVIYGILSSMGGGTLTPEMIDGVKSMLPAGLTAAEQNRAIQLIQGGMTLKQKTQEIQYQGLLNKTPQGVTVNIQGLSNSGGDTGRAVPKGSTGLSSTQEDQFNSDLTNALNAVNTIQNSGKNLADQNRDIGIIAARLQTTYGRDSKALAIINTRIPAAGASSSLNIATGKDLSQDQFNTDLASELATIHGSGLLGTLGLNPAKKTQATAAQARLLGKYPQYASLITTTFKPYLK